MPTSISRFSRVAVILALIIPFLSLTAGPAAAQATSCGIAPAGYNVIESDDAIIAGTQGDDFICAGPSANFIRAKGGDDIIHGGGGADTIKAGGGADIVYAGPGKDLVRGGAGADTIEGGAGDDTLIGQGGNDTIVGMSGDDIIRGKKGDDTLDGRGGKDIIRGDVGNDLLFGDANADLLIGGPGNDELYGGGGDDDLRGGANDDFLDGGTDDDLVNGGTGVDTISGGSGIDIVDGGGGQDNCALFGTQSNCETTDVPTGPAAPIATDDMAFTDEESPVVVNVLVNDVDANGDPLTISSVTSNGPALVLIDNTTGTISFDPTGVLDATPAGGSAIETFTYEISDGALTDTATVTVIVEGLNDAPKAANDLATGDGIAPVEVNVLANDFDIDGDALVFFGTPSGGQGYPGGAIIIEPTGTTTGTIRWDPSDAANGGANAYVPVNGDIVRITYTVVDPSGDFDTGTFEIEVVV